MENKNEKNAESMKESLNIFITELNSKLRSDAELDAAAIAFKDSYDIIYQKTGVMYCKNCGARMIPTAVDRASGQQFSCPKCNNTCSSGGISYKF